MTRNSRMALFLLRDGGKPTSTTRAHSGSAHGIEVQRCTLLIAPFEIVAIDILQRNHALGFQLINTAAASSALMTQGQLVSG